MHNCVTQWIAARLRGNSVAAAGTEATIENAVESVMVGVMNGGVFAGGVIIGNGTLGLKEVGQGEIAAAAGLEA